MPSKMMMSALSRTRFVGIQRTVQEGQARPEEAAVETDRQISVVGVFVGNKIRP